MMQEDGAVPADMLLLRERARKRKTPASGAAPTAQENDNVVLLEEDALVEPSGQNETPSSPTGALALYRPLAHVSLSAVAWSGPVDHALLQNAIVCAPARGSASTRPPEWLSAVVNFTIGEMPPDTPALYAALTVDDVALLGRTGLRHSRESALGLARASVLPSSIVGTDAATADAAASALGAYRRSALVYGWQVALHGDASVDATRDRDAAAIELISTLRAVLGEV
jgi:hypothetical protein